MLKNIFPMKVAAAALATFAAAAPAKQPAMYAYDLGTLNGYFCVPAAINDLGVVVGKAGPLNSERGCITGINGKGVADLGKLGTNTWPKALNVKTRLIIHQRLEECWLI